MAQMSRELAEQLDRLRAIFAMVEMPFVTRPGATDSEINEVERRTNMRFNPDLRALWRFSNGSGGKNQWFSVISDERTGCDFPTLSEALKSWHFFDDYNRGDAPEKDKNNAPWDQRINAGSLYRQTWFPVVEFNGFSTAVHFDSDPAPLGRYGQIVVYQHDPEGAYYVADSFIEFFRKSNDLMAANITDHFFMADEYERICHMSGTAELERQLTAGLDVEKKNWQGKTLRMMAIEADRDDLVASLDSMKRE